MAKKYYSGHIALPAYLMGETEKAFIVSDNDGYWKHNPKPVYIPKSIIVYGETSELCLKDGSRKCFIPAWFVRSLKQKGINPFHLDGLALDQDNIITL